jgi:hypothetical protein
VYVGLVALWALASISCGASAYAVYTDCTKETPSVLQALRALERIRRYRTLAAIALVDAPSVTFLAVLYLIPKTVVVSTPLMASVLLCVVCSVLVDIADLVHASLRIRSLEQYALMESQLESVFSGAINDKALRISLLAVLAPQ